MAYTNKYLFLRSSDRTLGSSSAFTVKLPTTYRNVSALSLVSAEIPFSFYNVASAFTAGVQFSHNGNFYNAVLLEGQYTITDFQAVLLSLLQTHLPSASVTAVNYSKVTAKLSISYSGGSILTAGATAGGRLGELMGCDPTGGITSSSAGVLSFPSVAQLFPYSSILMCVDNLPANVLSTSSLHCFARIQVNCAPGGVILIANGTNVVNSVSYSSPIPSLDSLTISLKNNDGTPLNLNGVNWTATLLISSTD